MSKAIARRMRRGESRTDTVADAPAGAETSLPTNFQGSQLPSVAFLSKSLSDENRLRILLCVSNGKKSVSAIVEELGLSQPLVSHHLKELKRCLLLRVERNGAFIYYELSDLRILDVIRTLSSMAADLLAARTTF
jgi:DNA-binding transcriptional ArsR family regulator